MPNPTIGGVFLGPEATNTLQETYNVSAQPLITLTAVVGVFSILDNAVPLGTDLFRVTDNLETSNFLRVSASRQDLGVHDSLTSVIGQPILRTLDGADGIRLWPTDRTITTASGSVIMMNNTYTHDYAGVRFGCLNLQMTLIHAQAGFPLNHWLLFNNGTLFVNDGSAVNFGPGQTFISQPTVRADTAAISQGLNRGFLEQTRFDTINGGSLSVSTWSQFQALGSSIGAGVTVTTRRGFQITNTTVTGALTTQLGIDIANLFSGGTNVALRLAQNAGTAIQHTGTAPVQFGGALQLGAGATVDWSISRAAANRADIATGDSLRLVNGSLQWVGTGGQIASSVNGELEITSTRWGFGIAPAGANWAFAFSATARSITVAGDFANCLNTTGGSHTINAALTTFTQWTVNAPAGTIGGGGSVVEAANMIIQTSVAVGTNRYGLHITSNPSGGGGNNQPLRVDSGESSVFDLETRGLLDFSTSNALGGGAAATLGTIGGTGPTAATQVAWIRARIASVLCWLAYWQ